MASVDWFVGFQVIYFTSTSYNLLENMRVMLKSGKLAKLKTEKYGGNYLCHGRVRIYVTEGWLRWLRILYRIKLQRLFPLLAEIRKTSLDFYYIMVTLVTPDWDTCCGFSRLLVCPRHPAAPACTWGNREWEGVCGGVFKVHSAGHPLKCGGT